MFDIFLTVCLSHQPRMVQKAPFGAYLQFLMLQFYLKKMCASPGHYWKHFSFFSKMTFLPKIGKRCMLGKQTAPPFRI
jgi:hypothetical protein